MNDTKLVSGFEQLAEATGIDAKTLKHLWHSRKISGIRAGHRTIFFSPAKVLADLARLEVRAVA